MSDNELINAVAGSGKTTHLVKTALTQVNQNLLITTYTQANESEIRKKIIKTKGFIPDNITVQTWFSFLLQHGVRPFQGVLYKPQIKGMLLVNRQSALYTPESDVQNFYFTNAGNIYSDKISKFILECNKLTGGAVIARLEEIFPLIYIDEVQDLASYDLDLLTLLFKSKTDVIMVGDPRQVTYLTHHARRLTKYSGGKLSEFVAEECKGVTVTIDDKTLVFSHRNNQAICDLSSKLYPEFPSSQPCSCSFCRKQTEHEGIFFVRKDDVQNYLGIFNPVQLRLRSDTKGIGKDFPVMNFGMSKGQSFGRVLIFPTRKMLDWLFDNNVQLAPKTRAQFYVAITRAKHSVGIVYDFEDDKNVEGIEKYIRVD